MIKTFNPDVARHLYLQRELAERVTARRAAGSVRDRDGGAATCEAVMTATYGGDDVSQRALPSDDD